MSYTSSFLHLSSRERNVLFNDAISYWVPYRTQWSRGLRRGLAATRLLRLRVRTLPGIWLSISCECCVSLGRVLCGRPHTGPEEYYRVRCVWVWSRNVGNEVALAQWGLLRRGKRNHSSSLCSVNTNIKLIIGVWYNWCGWVFFAQSRLNSKNGQFPFTAALFLSISFLKIYYNSQNYICTRCFVWVSNLVSELSGNTDWECVLTERWRNHLDLTEK